MEDYSQNIINEQREILSVSEINQTANDFILMKHFLLYGLQEKFQTFVEYGTSINGHWYFSIKDPNSVLNCTMFKFQNINLGFKPKEGDQVILAGQTFHL